MSAAAFRAAPATSRAPSSRQQAPVFVVGSPRSGTTLLYHMLLSAGGFALYRTETHVFNMLLPRFGDLSRRRDRERLLDYWLDSRFFECSGLAAGEVRELVLERCRGGGDFLRLIMGTLAARQGVGRWADCTPAHLLYMDAIKRAIPEALFVHMVRDGRDVALSLDRLGWIRPLPWDRGRSLGVAALFWEWMVERGRRLGSALGGDYLEVRYEHLVAAPGETLARIGPFLAHRLDYEEIRRAGIGSVSEPNTSFTAEFGDGSFQPVGRWRAKLSPPRVALVESLVGDTLAALGYPRSAPARPAGPGLRATRALYRSLFSAKHWARTATPLGRLLVDLRIPA